MLKKSKADAKNMLKDMPGAKDVIDWTYKTMPNDNWAMWHIRNVKNNPTLHNDKTKTDLEHFAGMAKVHPAIEKIRFDKSHDHENGINQLKEAEKSALASPTYVNKKGNKILDLGNGMAWWNLGVGSCKEEGAAMGHCGNEAAVQHGDEVLSLRKEIGGGKHEPQLTFIKNNGWLGEMKGRANQKPSKKYHNAIASLLLHPEIKHIAGGGYAAEKNFEFHDLDPELRQKVLAAKPHIDPLSSENPEELTKISNDIDSGKIVQPPGDLHQLIDFKRNLYQHALRRGQKPQDLAMKILKPGFGSGNLGDLFDDAGVEDTNHAAYRILKKTPERLMELAKEGHNDAKSLALTHPDFGKAHLDALIDSNEPGQRLPYGVGQHPAFGPDHLVKINQKKPTDFRYLLSDVARDKPEFLSKEHIDQILKDNPQAGSSILNQKNLTTKHLHDIYEAEKDFIGPSIEKLVSHPSADRALTEKFIHGNPMFSVDAIAHSPHATDEDVRNILPKLFREGHYRDASRILEKKGVDPEFLHNLIDQHSKDDIHNEDGLVTYSSGMPQSHKDLIKRLQPEMVFGNKKATPESLIHGIKNNYTGAEDAIRNPNSNADVLKAYLDKVKGNGIGFLNAPEDFWKHPAVDDKFLREHVWNDPNKFHAWGGHSGVMRDVIDKLSPETLKQIAASEPTDKENSNDILHRIHDQRPELFNKDVLNAMARSKDPSVASLAATVDNEGKYRKMDPEAIEDMFNTHGPNKWRIPHDFYANHPDTPLSVLRKLDVKNKQELSDRIAAAEKDQKLGKSYFTRYERLKKNVIDFKKKKDELSGKKVNPNGEMLTPKPGKKPRQEPVDMHSELSDRFFEAFKDDPAELQRHMNAIQVAVKGPPQNTTWMGTGYQGVIMVHPDKKLAIPVPVSHSNIDPEKELGVPFESEPFPWLDTKSEHAKDYLKYRNGKPLKINTRSDLLAHDDYLTNLDKKNHEVVFHFLNSPGHLASVLTPGMPSAKRLQNAMTKMKAHGVKVSAVIHHVNGLGDYITPEHFSQFQDHTRELIKHFHENKIPFTQQLTDLPIDHAAAKRLFGGGE